MWNYPAKLRTVLTLIWASDTQGFQGSESDHQLRHNFLATTALGWVQACQEIYKAMYTIHTGCEQWTERSS